MAGEAGDVELDIYPASRGGVVFTFKNQRINYKENFEFIKLQTFARYEKKYTYQQNEGEGAILVVIKEPQNKPMMQCYLF